MTTNSERHREVVVQFPDSWAVMKTGEWTERSLAEMFVEAEAASPGRIPYFSDSDLEALLRELDVTRTRAVASWARYVIDETSRNENGEVTPRLWWTIGLLSLVDRLVEHSPDIEQLTDEVLRTRTSRSFTAPPGMAASELRLTQFTIQHGDSGAILSFLQPEALHASEIEHVLDSIAESFAIR